VPLQAPLTWASKQKLRLAAAVLLSDQLTVPPLRVPPLALTLAGMALRPDGNGSLTIRPPRLLMAPARLISRPVHGVGDAASSHSPPVMAGAGWGSQRFSGSLPAGQAAEMESSVTPDAVMSAANWATVSVAGTGPQFMV
jgi:hypothetical protein